MTTASQLFSDFAALVKADETKMIGPLLATAIANYNASPTLVSFAAQAATFAESAINNQAIVGSEVAASMMALVNSTLQQMATADAAQLAASTAAAPAAA